MKRTLFVAALCCIGTLLGPGPCEAQTLKLSIGPVQVAAGQTVSIPLRVTGAAGVGSLQCELVYDPAVFEVVGVDKAALLGPYSTLESNPAVTPGRARLVLLNAAPMGAAGVMADIRGFVRGEPGKTTQLTIENAEANTIDASMQKIPVEIVNGALTVVAASDTTGSTGTVPSGDGGGGVVPKASGISAVLLGSVVVFLGAVALGLGILVLRRRRS